MDQEYREGNKRSLAHPSDHHRMPGHDPVGGGMLAIWWNLRRAA